MRETDPLAEYQMPALGRGREMSKGYTMPRTPDGQQMNFSRMQKMGMARPAPVDQFGLLDYSQPMAQMEPVKPTLPTAPAPTPFAPQIPTGATTTPSMPTTPTFAPTGTTTGGGSYGQPFDRIRQIAMENLSAQFGGQRQALEEDLARRGLSASSFGAGRLGDLAGQQARAQAQLEADLIQQRQAQENADRDLMLRLIAAMGG